jgi:hypothetical protein
MLAQEGVAQEGVAQEAVAQSENFDTTIKKKNKWAICSFKPGSASSLYNINVVIRKRVFGKHMDMHSRG